MPKEQHIPTGAEIDDRQWHDYGLIDDIKMGQMTSACLIWIAFLVVGFVGFLLGFAAKALLF